MAGRVVAVAYSGGRDSTALLHATLQAAAPLGITVHALHVHHGLSAHADAWLAHCQRQCATWRRHGGMPRFASERVAGAPPKAASIEAWARSQRYDALGSMARAAGARAVLLAHHRRDQAETFLLQALRGGGLDGLAAMPALADRDGMLWLRPWIDVAPSRIDAYVAAHRLGHVVDDSNGDPRFARNRLRRDVWPVLSAAFGDVEAPLAAATRHLQEALALQREWVAIDGLFIGTAAGSGLDLAGWAALSLPRRSAVLRAWLRRELERNVPAALADRLLAEAGRGNGRRWQAPDADVHERGGRLLVVRHGGTSTPRPSSGQGGP